MPDSKKLKELRDKLPHGKYSKISRELKKHGVNISYTQVKNILHGKYKDNHGVIPCAKKMLEEHQQKIAEIAK